MAKRILVGLLALAMLISCFAFAAIADSAQTGDDEVSLAEYEQVLEYFTEPVLINEDFSGYESGASYTNMVGLIDGQTAVVGKDDNGEHILVASTLTNRKAKSLYFNFDMDTALDNFAVEVIVSGAKKSLSIGVSETAQSSNVNMTATNFVTMEFGGNVKYMTDSATPSLKAADGSDFAIVANGIYKLQFVYRGDLGTYSITVTDMNDDTKTASASDVAIPVDITVPSVINNLQVGFAKSDIAGDEFKLYSIKALGGTVMRDEDNKDANVDKAITDLSKLIEDDSLSFEKKLEIVTIAGKIASYYDSKNNEVNELLATLVQSGITLYSDKVDSYLTALSDKIPYSQRKQAADDNKQYIDLIPENYAEILDSTKAAEVAAVIEKYNAEVTFLETAKADSEKFITALANVDTTSTDYGYLAEFYDSVSELEPYAGYDGIDAAKAAYDHIVAEMGRIRDGVNAFLEDVAILTDETTGFTVRYEAYLRTLESRLFREDPKNPDTLVENIVGVGTYYDENGKTAEAIDKEYLVARQPLVNIISDCETFISSVTSADYAGYINAKEAMLDIALSKMDTITDDYAGITKAKELYATVRAYVNETKAAALAYVEAVNALDGLSGDQLTAAIANAMLLRESGDVLGVDGVAEANIKLTEISTANILAGMVNDYFIALVEKACDENAATADLFEYITAAVKASEEASEDYSDVAAAKTELDGAIADYNALVDSFNAQFRP